MVAGATPLPTASLPLWQPPQPYMGTKLVLDSRIRGLKTSVGPGISAQSGLYYRGVIWPSVLSWVGGNQLGSPPLPKGHGVHGLHMPVRRGAE